jgi:hypothetical protein
MRVSKLRSHQSGQDLRLAAGIWPPPGAGAGAGSSYAFKVRGDELALLAGRCLPIRVLSLKLSVAASLLPHLLRCICS